MKINKAKKVSKGDIDYLEIKLRGKYKKKELVELKKYIDESCRIYLEEKEKDK